MRVEDRPPSTSGFPRLFTPSDNSGCMSPDPLSLLSPLDMPTLLKPDRDTRTALIFDELKGIVGDNWHIIAKVMKIVDREREFGRLEGEQR